MKQLIKTFATSMLLILGIATFSFAQNSYANNQVKAKQISNPIITAAEYNTSSNVIVSKEMEAKFLNLFPAATEQKWTETAVNYFVSFFNDGRKANASISPKGKMRYVITDCTMDQLPEAFIKNIKNNYKGYQLFHATEITAHAATAYQAVIENATGFITLKYTADGVEEIRKIKK